MLTYIAGTVSEKTAARYAKQWGEYAAFCVSAERDAMRPASVLAWRTELVGRGYSPNTINAALSGLKSLFRAACAAEVVSIEDYAQIKAVGSVSVRSLRDRLRPSKDVLDDDKVRKILDGIDRTNPKGLRDYAILAVLATAGLRIEEVSRIKIGDWDVSRHTLNVRGKTDVRARKVPVSELARHALFAWLFSREDYNGEWMFPSFAGKSGVVQDKPITTQAVHGIVVSAAAAVGINVSAHDFRRYVATKLANSNIASAQAVLGHASIMTTQRYVQQVDLPSVDWLG